MRHISVQHSRWSEPTSDAEAQRRAGGRRAFNARRRFQRLVRRIKVIELLGRYGFFRNGAKIARELGVSRATICCDRRAILRGDWAERKVI
jgi:hypothetical protein